MGKIKTKKAIIKRIRLTSNKKILHKAPGLSHLLASKTVRNKNRKLKLRSLSKFSAKTLLLGINNYTD